MKSFLDQIKANLSLIMVVFLVLSMIFIGYQCGVTKEAKRTAGIFEKKSDEIKKEADEKIEKLYKKNDQLEDDNFAKDKVIAKKETENENLIKKREEDQRKMKEMEKKIQSAIPETLLGITRRILNTDEVWLIKEKVAAEFSLAAFRDNTLKLADWEDFTLKREPKYQQQIANDAIVNVAKDGKILNLYSKIGNLKIVIQEDEIKYQGLNKAFEEWKRYAKKKGGVFKTIADTLLKLGVGYALAKVIDK